MLGETEADEIVVLDILRGLEVSHSPHSIIESVLNKYEVKKGSEVFSADYAIIIIYG